MSRVLLQAQLNFALLDQIPRRRITDVDVLATLLKRRIIGETDGTLIIGVD